MKVRFFLGFWSVLLTLTTFVLGAAPLYVLRKSSGRAALLLMSLPLLVISGATGTGWMFFSWLAISLLVEIQVSLEEQHFDFRSAAFGSIGLVSALTFFGVTAWQSFSGQRLVALLKPFFEESLVKLNSLGETPIVLDQVLAQLPSFFVICLGMSLALALIFESRISKISGLQAKAHSLAAFKAPDFFIWALVVVIPLVFGKFENKAFELWGTNFLNILVLAYFFQGLAVTSQFFKRMKLSSISRALLYFVLVVHLGIFVSLLGVIDYWADFRKRIKKNPPRVPERAS